MDIFTGIKDMNGRKILLGIYLQNFKCKYLTYQVRIRNNEFVLHTGGCYRSLTQDNALSNLKIVETSNIEILGLGATLYNTALTY